MKTHRPSDMPPVDPSSEETLPEFWPDSPATRVARKVWIPWPVAVVLSPVLWILPRRVGAHFAQVRWAGAIVAHVVWFYYGVAWLLLLDSTRWESFLGPALGLQGRPEYSLWPEPTLSEVLREPLARIVPTETDSVLRSLLYDGLGVLTMEGILLGLAILLTPYATAGERLKWLWGRSIRLVLWGSTTLTAVGICANLLAIAGPGQDMRELAACLCIVGGVWFLIRLSQGYAGRCEGVEWEPIAPQCETCGYGLTGLMGSADCPECGRPVRTSLPMCRRPSPFAAAEGFLGRIARYVPTYIAALRGGRFFQTLRIRGEHPGAVRFAMWTCVLTAMLLSSPIVDVVKVVNRSEPGRFDMAALWDWCEAGEVWCVLAVLLMGVLGAVAILWSRLGWRPIQRYSVVTFYESVWLLPIGAAVVVATRLAVWLERAAFHTWPVRLPELGVVDLYDVLAMSPVAVPIVLAVHGVFRLNRDVRETTFANA